MRHPHLAERQTVQTGHDRILGEFQIPSFPRRFSSFPKRLDLEAPFLGEHNRRILSSCLGYFLNGLPARSKKACFDRCRASCSGKLLMRVTKLRLSAEKLRSPARVRFL
jgi:hypothetical protein